MVIVRLVIMISTPAPDTPQRKAAQLRNQIAIRDVSVTDRGCSSQLKV